MAERHPVHSELSRPRVKFGEIYRGINDPEEFYLVIEYDRDDVLFCVNLGKDNTSETRWFYHGGTMSTSELGVFVERLSLEQVLELQMRGFEQENTPVNDELIGLIKKYAVEDEAKTQIRV